MYKKKWMNQALSIMLSAAMVTGSVFTIPAEATEPESTVSNVTHQEEAETPTETPSTKESESTEEPNTTMESEVTEESSTTLEPETTEESNTTMDSEATEESNTTGESEGAQESNTTMEPEATEEPAIPTESIRTEESEISKEMTSSSEESAFFTSTAKTLSEDIVYQFDFGTKKGSAPDNFFNGSALYDEQTGYGLASIKDVNSASVGTDATFDDAAEDPSLRAACADISYMNSTTDPLEFLVDLSAGTYEIQVYAGGVANNKTYAPNNIYINGSQVSFDTALGKGSKSVSDICYTKKVTLKKDGQVSISAKNSGGRAYMNAIVIKTAEPSAFPAPQNITASATESSVTLTWDAVEDADHYTIFRSTSENDGSFLQIGNTSDTSYTDPILTTKNYYYRIISVGTQADGTPVSEPSNSVMSDIESSTSIGSATPAESYSDRALVAVKGENGIFTSWRSYESDSDSIRFTLNRNGTEIYSGSKTNFHDPDGKAGDTYTLIASEGLSDTGESVTAWDKDYQEFTLQTPPSQTMPDGSTASYISNDMSVGDLDGDGQLELIVKWYPSNAKDNSQDGYTGTTILDAYDIDISTGTANLMWRIDLGLNIRSGAHYTQFQVWDYDGDGKAEIMCKTADGTTTFDAALNETGHVGGCSVADLPTESTDSAYDHRQHSGRKGRIVLGDEYLTVFNGETGEIIDSANFVPFRGTYDETTGVWDTTHWGLKNGAPAESNDGYANRADRFLSATAYLDEGSPSAVFSRGYYGRTAITAWKLINGKLTVQWTFDVSDGDEYAGQGNHGLSINDVDNDGLDEIIYGSLTLDQDGSPLYTTGLGHGDAMHVSDWNGDGKLEIYQVHEEAEAKYHAELHDAETGEIIWGYNNGSDTGRGVAADIDPRYSGAEMWYSLAQRTLNVDGDEIYSDVKPSQNFSIFWDGDLLMELFDSNDPAKLVPQVQKWNYEDMELEVIKQLDGTQLNNGTKANAGLVADILGDWREEIIVRDANDANKIRLYTTTIQTEYSIPCFLEDRAYREGVAWQNVGYNQPANLSYLLTKGLKTAEIEIEDRSTNTVTISWTEANDGIYGHPITGYQILRALCTDGEAGNYQQIAQVDTSTFQYMDTGLTPNTEYCYKVISMVDGKESYSSLPAAAKTAVSVAGVQPFEALNFIQDSEDYLEKFPTAATVVDADGTEQTVDITWDLSQFHISDAGTFTIYGTIYGRSEKVPLTVHVKPNKVLSYHHPNDVYTLIGTEPTLPNTLTFSFLNGQEKELSIDWNRAYDINSAGDYPITGTAVTAYGEVITVNLTVSVKQDYITSLENPEGVEIEYGTPFSEAAAKLPSTIQATWASDGRTEQVAVIWDKIDTNKLGTTIVYGRIEKYASFAQIEVNIDYPSIYQFDFGIEGSPVADGWINIPFNVKGNSKTAQELGIAYTSQQKYGFINWEENGILEGRSQNYTKDGKYPKEVYQDLALASTSTQSNTFVVDVENGSYIVEMMSGSTDKSTVKVNIEGKAYSVGNDANTYEVGRFGIIEVTDGQLTMEFTSGNYSRLNAIVIRKVIDSVPTDANTRIESGLMLLPETGEKLTPYDIEKIDHLASIVSEMNEEEKSALKEETLSKLDTLYQQAHHLTLEITVGTPDTIAPALQLSNDFCSIKGAFLASGLEEGQIELVIAQQQPQKGDNHSFLEFTINLLVNGEACDLKAPVILSLDLPEGANGKNFTIQHYTDDGILVQTLRSGDILSEDTFVQEENSIKLWTNGFSTFSFVLTEDSSNNNSDKDSSSSSNSSSSSRSSANSDKATWVQDSSGWKYQYANGTYASSTWEHINSDWYYFDLAGYRQTGWSSMNLFWYYLEEDGKMAANEWIKDGDSWYYLSQNGIMAVNWLFHQDHWYYLNSDGSMATGWKMIDTDWYFFSPDGSMTTGWILDNGNWYYMDQNGKMAMDTTTPDGYYVNSDGVMTN